ncbi:MAG: GSCFA domain-containing protein [Fibrobacter sp.]|nr:GSCFA domain-containing protein [Fibrobacter sp.]
MEFFTKVDIPASSIRIDYTSRIAFFGSCFADNISAQFAARKFNVLANPFGTVYNPLSIERQLKRIASGKEFGEEDVFQDEHGVRVDRGSQDARGVQDARGLWHCWDAHGSLSAATREDCIAKLNAASSRAREFLQKADTVFITLGSAFVYYLKDCSAAAGNGDARGKVVANCHRQDPRLFERRLISVDEAAEAIRGIVECLRKIAGRDLHIVFTVSPLRHLGDGAHGNNLSKSTLLLAIDKADTSYFPSYEIVMDELRDYRFYDSDLVHLSKTAEEHIFARMVESYCDDTTRTNIARVEKFMKMANHRIVNAGSPTAIEFAKNCAAQARELEKQIPGLTLHVPG